jgi:hypothetical protein
MTEYGIWSDAAGGFIAGPLYTRPEAESMLSDLTAAGEDDAEIVVWFNEDGEDDE